MSMKTAKLIPLALLVAVVAGLTLAAPDLAGPVLERITFHDGFESGNLDAWQFPYAEDWSILSEPTVGGRHYLHMNRSREPGVPRRPLQFALIKNVKVGSFVFQARVRREGKSMIVVFNYVDTLHFYYVHLSGDRGAQQPVHNGIFIVDGGPRWRTAGIDARAALPDKNWHRVRITRNARLASINVFMDDERQPLFSVLDSTFRCGQVGIGSFDETGDFEDVSLKSTEAGCQPFQEYYLRQDQPVPQPAVRPAKSAGLR